MSTTQSITDEAGRYVAANGTTGRRGVLLPLLRKEVKQLFPLVAVLIGSGVFLHLLGLLQSMGSSQGFHITLSLIHI